jgi:circadian clock protein KaiC
MPNDKSPTGIHGLDEITGGGLPQGRSTLVCGGAGCGKTLLGMEFLVHGALQFGDPGVFFSFEESVDDLVRNVASLGFDLHDLCRRHLLALDCVRIERGTLAESGAYDLEGLFIRLDLAIASVGAKRVVLDTIESLFSVLPNQAILRAELRRLFLWLKERDVTTILTGEQGNAPGMLTRHGFEEYVSDCVIVLDHRVAAMISSRRLRVIKYRGSTHGTNEYPFLIDEGGISLLPITSLSLAHHASSRRVPSGVPGLDAMLGGAGYFCGSSVLVSGTAGTGKSSLAAHFANAACARGERVLYFAFEESPEQITRNMHSIGIDLAQWTAANCLRFHASRPTLTGLEMHLVTMLRQIAKFDPQAVVVDPLNSFVGGNTEGDVKLMLLRLVDSLKLKQITGFFTSLTEGGAPLEKTDVAMSSLIDTWLLVRDIESAGERHRGLCILKSRGMPHSNQIREFLLTGHGIDLGDAFGAGGGAAPGPDPIAKQTEAHDAPLRRQRAVLQRQNELDLRRAAMEVRIAALRSQFAAEEAAALGRIEQVQAGGRWPAA